MHESVYLPEATTVHASRTVSWRSYLALTKPRIISLLLFTALTAMFIASDAHHPVTWTAFLAVAIGGYMAAGAANTFNMLIDRDIDATMVRTAERPTVTQEVTPRNAFLFGTALTVGSFGLLWAVTGLLSALMAFSGLLFYVVIYTLLLKRRTTQNIVIGGAAGCFPPLVGWAAVTHHLAPMAWLLFAIIFFWTPVHFWALALLIKDDYARAGVPMLPVIRGDKTTVNQIALYTVPTVLTTLLPLKIYAMGTFYLLSCVIINAGLIYYVCRIHSNPSRPQALWLFKYSMIYLALIFLTMAIARHI
ncbi:protoheme IX farnesyltransferase [Chthonomonas calidirosea]|uniref:Protoheme IX farnesyltransferase n=2 Tax=Chthonomonas TaxID=1077265 RepID=S0EXR9_CHTCT|nr:heme o synthase [Chthonomonas calidirosea]CCW35096.1 protoheme IX farnesyltransferase [Chthonomonas calidirosea T49]CEK20317.1 protoheme IX farnesyltransferase [Chthonomonas calidirosea]CEK20318.1 protoheme IX farnesyltransferase [Chthonomonas calidirosea]CEK20887.1 protoheme IX farnesyltransferase [Chthonomonas calidirosea]